MLLQKTKSISTTFSLRTIINGNINLICYDYNDVLPPCSQSISNNGYNKLSPLHIPMKEHNNIMDGKNQIKSIEFERFVSIGIQDTTYGFNDIFWDSISTFLILVFFLIMNQTVTRVYTV